MNDRLHSAALAVLPDADSTASRPAAGPAANGARILLDTLIAHGVDTIFGYPGGAVLPLYDALYAEPRLRHVLVRHEQAAVHAAEGYARSTGRTGVVFVTSGPGMANTTSGLLDAMCDSIPVLCISGQVATAAIGTDAFQECDAIGISRSVTKWNTQVRAVDDVAAVVSRAFELTRQGRPGPVLLDFPRTCSWPCRMTPTSTCRQRPRSRSWPRCARRQAGKLAPAAAVGRAPRRRADRTSQASYFLWWWRAGERRPRGLRRLHRAGAPHRRALHADADGPGRLSASSPQFVGMLGMHGTVEANLAMHNADLVVCIGARFDDRITGKLSEFCPHARKIHIDIDPASINKVVRVDVALVGDCLPLVQALRAELGDAPLDPARLAPWWDRIATWRAGTAWATRPRPSPSCRST